MTSQSEIDPRYPVGQFTWRDQVSPDERQEAIREIAVFPRKLRSAVAGLSEVDLETRYRPGGWTIRQVVHHVADSHVHSYIRFKLALTENGPTIKPYDEARTAELADTRATPIEASLRLIEGLHERWARLLENLSEAEFARTFYHPERGVMALSPTAVMYAWHCRHHLAHIELAKRNCKNLIF